MKRPIATRSFNNPSSSDSQGSECLTYLENLGEIGTVSDTISPNKPGRIRYQGSWWPALCTQNVVLPVGSTVRVIGIKTITCIVESLHQ